MKAHFWVGAGVVSSLILSACASDSERAERHAKDTCRLYYEEIGMYPKEPPPTLYTEMKDSARRAAQRDDKWKVLAQATKEYAELSISLHDRRGTVDEEERLKSAIGAIGDACFDNFGSNQP